MWVIPLDLWILQQFWSNQSNMFPLVFIIMSIILGIRQLPLMVIF